MCEYLLCYTVVFRCVSDGARKGVLDVLKSVYLSLVRYGCKFCQLR